MYDTFYIIDLMLLFSLSWFVLLPDCLSCYVLFCTPYTCYHVRHLYLWSGVFVLCVCSVFFSCSLLSIEDEFFIELRF